MTELHIPKADENAVCNGAVPHLGVCQWAEAELVQISAHVQKQTAAGHKINLQNIILQRRDG